MVKLQTVLPDFSYCSGTLSHDIFTKLSFSIEELLKIKEYCFKRHNNIYYSRIFLDGNGKTIKLSVSKISSGLMNNLPLVEAAAKLNKRYYINRYGIYA